MDALHAALRKIHDHPGLPASLTLQSLIESLDMGGPFDLSRLYQLNYSEFELALELMKQWRLDTYRYERGWAAQAARGGVGAAPASQAERYAQLHQ
ncbi:MAG: hypothetical protein IT532_15335 [Burkholderiales bacterium]|nr:hypothetical protein [Burkholderiales bacterium]